MYSTLKKNIFYILGLLVIIAYSCAVARTPEGGPKDYTPPKMISSEPQMNAVNFDKKKVILSFDEFIELKDIQKSFVISPPSRKRITPVLKGNNKEILIAFEDSLKPNTTYSLNFGNSIVDLHEGNPLPNFSFTFSTGSVVDSLSITGKVMEAKSLTPDKEGVFVMLYPIFNDTIPRKTLPSYITKTNAKGWFTIPHVMAGTYMIFALKDANMNYMFDQPGESIAFSDTLIVMDKSYYQQPDTSFRKVVFSDSLKVDSIDFYKGKKPQIELYYFKEEHHKQKFYDYSRSQPNQFVLNFELPVDSLGIDLIKTENSGKNWFVKDNNLINDTISYWITDTALVNKDTIAVKLSYTAPDSLNNLRLVHDTVKLVFKKPATKAKRTSLIKSSEKLSITCSSSKKSEVDLNEKLFFESTIPVEAFHADKIMLTVKEDTLQVPVKFEISRDSIYLRRFNFSFPLVPNSQYQLIIDTLAFTSIYGQNNDSTGTKFKTRKDDYYGTLSLNLKNISGPMIVQFLNEQGQLLQEKYKDTDGVIKFDYLSPGKYKMKVIYDRNGNKKWDTGEWGLRKQPEKVEFYSGEISIRSNWEVEATWELGKELPAKSLEPGTTRKEEPKN